MGDATVLAGSGNTRSAIAGQGSANQIDTGVASLSPEDAGFIALLRGKFGPVIHGKHEQIRAIEQLIAYLQARYPDTWRDHVRDFLKQLFPDLAEQLYAQFEKLTRYDDWLREHRAELMKLSAQERRQKLWDLRREVFGADAEEIWAADRRNERIADTLTALESAQGKTTGEKLDAFLGTIRDAYGERAPQFIQSRQAELMNRFLSVETVQSDLQAMSPPERKAALRQIRSGMRMEEEALQRWDGLDRQRDQAWDAGLQYVQQREQIVKQTEGEERTRQLHELQDRSFGAEAETIRSEEASGFFRFAHRRRIGRE